MGIPLAGTINIRQEGKICDFQLQSLFILETVRDRPMVTMDHQQKVIGSRTNDPCGFQ